MSTKNIIIHPIEDGQENKEIELFPITKKENIVDFQVGIDDIDTENKSKGQVLGSNYQNGNKGGYIKLKTINNKPLISDHLTNIYLQPAAFDYKEIYIVTTTVTNGTYVSDGFIEKNGTTTITVTPDSGYALPTTITVTGASSSYSDSTGVITLSNPTGNVSIEVVCTAVAPTPSMNPFALNQTVNGITINPNGTVTGYNSIGAWLEDLSTPGYGTEHLGSERLIGIGETTDPETGELINDVYNISYADRVTTGYPVCARKFLMVGSDDLVIYYAAAATDLLDEEGQAIVTIPAGWSQIDLTQGDFVAITSETTFPITSNTVTSISAKIAPLNGSVLSAVTGGSNPA